MRRACSEKGGSVMADRDWILEHQESIANPDLDLKE
jgi:hypothetical protein